MSGLRVPGLGGGQAAVRPAWFCWPSRPPEFRLEDAYADDPRTGLFRVAPAVAAKVLEVCNTENVRYFVRTYTLRIAIERGEWRVTHQGLAFLSGGVLMDGQNRLRACV